MFLTGTHRFDLVNYIVSDNPTAWLVGHAEEPAPHQSVVPTQRGVDVGGTAYVVYQNGVLWERRILENPFNILYEVKP